MTGEELDAIEARAKAATPGPWAGYDAWTDGQDINARCVGSSDSTFDTVLQPNAHTDIRGRRADWEFILHARQDIPALVAEVRRLRSANS